MTALKKTLRHLATLALFCGGLLAAGCGRPDSLAVVNVTGLDPSIVELYVTMTLDGAKAKNSQPTQDDPDNMSFSVYQDMQQFGIDVPAGTTKLGITVNGINPSRVVIRTGSGTLDFTQHKDIDIALQTAP